MADDLIAINGVNAASGEYLIPPLPPEQVSQIAQGETIDPAILADLKAKLWRETEQHFAPMEGIDPNDLAQAGWGVVFAHNADPAVRDALKELLDFRKGQAGRVKENFYREFAADKGYRTNDPRETKRTFLARSGAAAGQPADPDKVPYFLLLVGDPDTIPYRFQYQIDIEYAVGRVWFEKDGKPDLEAFARYARSVVDAESGRVPLARTAAFVGVQNDEDRATKLSAVDLVQPLAQKLAQDHAGWKIQTHLKDEAKKAHFARLLGGEETPTFLFTASHGVGFPNGDPRQLIHQGALLCQDWPGPMRWRQPIGPDFYFAADDVASDARLLGLIAFHFACYGAGTPALDDFGHLRNALTRDTIAPHPFVARLPQRLLSSARGGALAVIGHVERAWGCSFYGGGRLGRQLQTFQSTLTRLLEGQRIGWALEYFNQLYAALAADLTEELENVKYGKVADNVALSDMWTSSNDARSFVVIGDPAVRLPLATDGQTPVDRPTIAMVNLQIAANAFPPTPAGPPPTSTSTSTSPPPAKPAPEPGPSFEVPREGPALRPRAVGSGEVEMVSDGGSAMISIPLQINVRLGNVSAGVEMVSDGGGVNVSIPLQINVRLGGVSAGAVATAVAAPESFAVGGGAPSGPTDTVPGTGLGYYLLAFDGDNRDRTPDASRRAVEALTREPITDVFLFSHGWRGDVPAAREQYTGWIRAMAAQRPDVERIAQFRPGFRPLLIGLHWPSEPWGDEGLAGPVSYALGEAAAGAGAVAGLVDDFVRRLGDRPDVRDPLRTIIAAAQSGAEPDHLPAEVEDAYRALDRALGLGAGGVAADPGADREPFDPEAVYQEFLSDAGPAKFGFGLPGRDTLLAPLRALSFWTMKDRARRFGELAVHSLLRRLLDTAAGRDVRFHLMGHSFGCIVASAGVAGPPGSAALPRPVDSLALVQGAFSLWSFCDDIPSARGTPGYFHRVVRDARVRGPIVTTQSRFDTAVGTWYPRAAWAGGQVNFGVDELPRYGAVGSFGIRGSGVPVVNDVMRPAGAAYAFQPGRVYNLEGSGFINEGSGTSGAHSDIRKPAVAHAVWAAALP